MQFIRFFLSAFVLQAVHFIKYTHILCTVYLKLRFLTI